MTKTITLAHGNGGAENNELIKEVFMMLLKWDFRTRDKSAAVIQNGTFTFSRFICAYSKSTFFNGANIGKLAICGTLQWL